ncbi:uncharacterized protein LOC124916754 [Impatiens glandulifera]|uniref:uncharacterized protein LOC124916754 n=1 Tax=Impatiens glandulifera TaxID=253017 RepID=UPI001FB12C9D|nr:uncharacterized protein LOC124916754 [Impatiens glandulifera]
MKNPLSSSSSSTPYQTRFSSPAGFFSTMIRRLLFCSNSLPPSNHSSAGAGDNLYAMSAPCLVARLMGLDSLPMNNESSQVSRLRREEPNYAELEDDHFFILSFEKKFRSKKDDRSKMGYGKLKKRNQERRKVYSNSKENRNPNEDPYESSGKKKKIDEEAESDSDWSPVSVLDIDEFATTSSDLSTPVNETEEIHLMRGNFKLLLTSPRTNLLISSFYNNNNNRMPNNSKWRSKKRKMWNEIGRISEEEMARSRWDYGEASKLQEFEEIGDCITEILLREILEEMN